MRNVAHPNPVNYAFYLIRANDGKSSLSLIGNSWSEGTEIPQMPVFPISRFVGLFVKGTDVEKKNNLRFKPS